MIGAQSPLLSFSRNGRTLLAIDGDSVVAVDTHTGEPTRIAMADARGVIGFVDQIWIVRGHEPVLVRHALDGRVLGAPLALAAGSGVLTAAPVGAPAAVWSASHAMVLVDEAGTPRIAPGPTGCDVVLPLTGRRWVTATGSRVVAPSGLTCDLPSGSRVTGGAIVLDGSAALIIAERSNARDLVVVGLSTGRPQLRLPAPSANVRAATRRGIVAVLVEPRRIAVLDLRSGRLLGMVATSYDIVDHALDPDGQRIALREPGNAIELAVLRDAFAAAIQVAVGEDSEATEAVVAEEQAATPQVARTALPDATAPASTIVRPLELRALVPLVPRTPIARELALELLDRDMRTIALLTLCAIAEAWDTRRIGYGNEGKHPYEHEVAALVGMNRGFATAHLAAAREHLAAHEASFAPDRPNFRMPNFRMPNFRMNDPATPLGALAEELGLSALAVEVLLVVAAPALWSEAARLYGILANDPSRALVDEALVEQILGKRFSRHELAAELEPRSPLVRFGVIAIDRAVARPFAALAVDPIVLSRLRCDHPNLGTGLVARGSDRALEELALGPDVIRDALHALARAPGHARIALRGRPGSGRRTLLASLAAEAGRALGVIETGILPRGDLAPALRAALQRAQLAGLLPCVTGLEDTAFGDPTARDTIVDTLRTHPGPLAVVLPAGESAPLDAGHVAIDLPVLAEGERLTVWGSALADAGLALDARVLAARYRIGPGAIHRAIAAAVERVREHDAGDPALELERHIRQTRDTRLGAHASRVERLGSWDGLVLPPDVLDSLHELVARVRHRRQVFETWGMDRTMATSRGLTALFSGPPGTGKTLVAGVIARELGLELYQVDLSKLMSKWIGETERNLASIFDAAEDGQVILLFDEADSLFAKRTEVRSSNDRYANLEVNYLLQRLDSFEGIAILTTNASGSIDSAFKRRLSFCLSFPFPDEETREQLWRAHLPPTLPQAGAFTLDRLARKYQLSGGYIRNACLRAAFLAAQDACPVSQNHLERAVALEFAELGKLSTSGTID